MKSDHNSHGAFLSNSSLMDDNSVAAELSLLNQANVEIPVDYFVSKKLNRKGFGGGDGNLDFVDASGNMVFRRVRGDDKILVAANHNKKRHHRLLVDASGNHLISMYHSQNGSWQGFRRNSNGVEDLIFRVERTLDTFSKTEFEVFLVNEDFEESKPDFKIKGCAFYRSCTIYRGNSIVAQTSLMYKLGIWKVYVPRSRFRLTIFPGLVHHALVVALIVIFFDGRKIWI